MSLGLVSADGYYARQAGVSLWEIESAGCSRISLGTCAAGMGNNCLAHMLDSCCCAHWVACVCITIMLTWRQCLPQPARSALEARDTPPLCSEATTKNRGSESAVIMEGAVWRCMKTRGEPIPGEGTIASRRTRIGIRIDLTTSHSKGGYEGKRKLVYLKLEPLIFGFLFKISDGIGLVASRDPTPRGGTPLPPPLYAPQNGSTTCNPNPSMRMRSTSCCC